MKLFTSLYLELDGTTRTSEKREALVRYFKAADPIDAAWAVYLLSGRRVGKAVSFRLLRAWTAEVSGYPGWLVDQCYTLVGDLSETISLIIPPGNLQAEVPALHEMVEQRLRPLSGSSKEQVRRIILETWAILNSDQRLVFHKLLSGNYRIGVSKQMLVLALAEVAGVAPAVIAHRLAGHWSPDETTMARLLSPAGAVGETDSNLPYPFMLAHALSDPLASLGEMGDWLIEWKWDGIRAQVIRRGGKTAIWSRGDELVTHMFPETVQAAARLPEGTVLDGEILAWNSARGRPLPFTQLQPRLNRKSVELTFWPEVQVLFQAFDALEVDAVDLRENTLRERRERLASVLKCCDGIVMSKPVEAANWEEIAEMVGKSREKAVEGVMLKRWDSTYRAGRPTGLWWKLKVQPYTVDAVMIAAEAGHGRRAGLLTDYTFGVWNETGKLVPIAKAYSGLTDVELLEIDRFARSHTVSRHGPVHAVEPVMVFELGFEAIQESTRHQSGIAVRFPRILRIRKDKQAKDADRLIDVKALLKAHEAMS